VFDEHLHFDEKIFNGWHCYGADYCLSLASFGLKSYVIPAFIYHRSLLKNTKDLLKYQVALYKKHKKHFKHIFTTCEEISMHSLVLQRIIEIIRPAYKVLFPDWSIYLKRELANCGKVLDLGCGYNSPLQYCNVPFKVGVDLFEPYLETSKGKGIHNKYIRADIREVEFDINSFDAVIAIEVLEHLTKQEGFKLLEKMSKWAKKKVIVTTPNGYLFQEGYDNNPLQEHRSGWNIEELKKLGFKVHGINGWKKLRGHKSEIIYYPVFFWRIISDITQKITYHFPNLSFQLIAIKEIGK